MHIRASTKYQFLTWGRIGGISGLLGFLSIGGVAILEAFKVLDFGLIVNLWVAEAPVAYMLYFVVERKPASISHAIDLMDFADKYKHLKLHSFRKLLLSIFVVENTTTGLAFLAPDYLTYLNQWIKVSEHPSEEAFENDLNNRKVTNNFPRKASLHDLLPQPSHN